MKRERERQRSTGRRLRRVAKAAPITNQRFDLDLKRAADRRQRCGVDAIEFRLYRHNMMIP